MPGVPADCAARYRVERLLGEGAYGRVYLAHQEQLGRPVALKILRSEVLADDEQRRRFVDEGRIAARMSHPNIVRVIDADAACGTPWLVFELVDGPSLRDAMAKGGLSLRQALEVGVSVASALEEAHRQGIVHRDVKAENVLRAADGSYKLADFGIARWTADSRVKTAEGVFLGTPTHVAPELIRGGEPSPASDVYALGVMLFELVTGRLPFEEDRVGELFRAHLTEPAPAPSRLRPEIPGALDGILARALEKNPVDRTRSARELGRALAQLLATTAGASDAARRPTDLPVRPFARLARGVAGAGLLAIGLALALRVAAPRRTPEPILTASRPAPAPAAEPASTGEWLAGERGHLNTLLEELAGRLSRPRDTDIGLGPVPLVRTRELELCFQRLIRRLAHVLDTLSERRVRGPAWLEFCATIATLRAHVLAVGKCWPELLAELERLVVREASENPFQMCIRSLVQAELRLIRGESPSAARVSVVYATAHALLSGSGPDDIMSPEQYHFACSTVAVCRIQAAIQEGAPAQSRGLRELLEVTHRIVPALRGPGGAGVANMCAYITLLAGTIVESGFRTGDIPRAETARFVRDLLAIVACATSDYSRGRATPLVRDVAKLAVELGIDASPVEQHWKSVPAKR